MTDREQATATYANGGNGQPARLGAYQAYDDFASADAATGLVSLAFLKEAIRRRARFCAIMTVIGFLVGCGIYVMSPPRYQASASLLLTYGPYENGPGAASDNQAIAQTRTVAGLAMRELGLRGNVDSFLSDYTVAVVSNQVLLITFTAPSASEAVRGANAVATQFLRFRAGKLEQEQALVSASLDHEVSQAGQKLSSLTTAIKQVRAQPATPAQRSQLTGLQAQLRHESAVLANLQQAVNGNDAAARPATTMAVRSSQVVDAAALLPRSQLRDLLLYPLASLVGGLAVGIGVVLIAAIVSDRLRRRDDVAAALGAPVALSTGPLRPKRLARPGRAAADPDIRAIAAHLGRALPDDPRGAAALAVVAVDNAESVALPLLSLAASRARQGQRVVLADLASGSPAGRLLGCREPGVSAAEAHGAPLRVVIPERGDAAPGGPLGPALAREQPSPFADAVAAAYADADVLLSLVTLDPSSGGGHLATWAAHAVVVVTAGASSWTRLNAVAEMIRVCGTRLVSAVLVGADSADESLGAGPVHQEVVAGAEAMERGPRPRGNGLAPRPAKSAAGPPR